MRYVSNLPTQDKTNFVMAQLLMMEKVKSGTLQAPVN